MARHVVKLVVGSCAAAALVFATAGAQTQRPNVVSPGGASAGLVTHVVSSADRPTQLVVVDPQRLVVSVYHIAQESGEIQLKSVRPIRWDLELSEFDTADPKPQHVRDIIQRQR